MNPSKSFKDVSIAVNIAEGFVKRTKPEKMRLMNIAQGSLEECKYYLILSADLKYGDSKELGTIAEEVSKLPVGYLKAIEASK